MIRVLGPVVLLVGCAGDPAEKDGLVPEDLGTVVLNDTGGYIEQDIVIPEGAVSTMAWCGGWGDAALGAVWTLTDAAGAAVYSGDAPDAGGFRSDFLDDLVPALLPVTPKILPTAGTWHVQWFVGGGNDGSAECGVVHRTGTVSSAAAIRVAFVFVGVLGADAAADDPNWQAAVGELEAEWATAGIEATFDYADFAGDTAKYTVVDITDDDLSELNDLLRTSDPEDDATITFFVVEDIANSSTGSSILGLSAGPPGAAGVHGTSKSGVVVSAADLASAPTDVGRIMAHEGGHFLGLFHTTEKDGSRFDPLDDTPECGTENDANGDGTMNTVECAADGSDNMMWWTLTPDTATTSDDQGFVLRSNPVAR